MGADIRDYLAGFFQQALFRLHNSFAATYFTVWSLRDYLRSGDIENTPHGILVPDADGKRWVIERSSAQVSQIIKYQAETGQFERNLVFIIAEVEDFIASIIRVVLVAHPTELMFGLRNAKSEATIELSRVVSATSLKEILGYQIEQKISNIMRERAKDFLEYLAGRLRASLKTKEDPSPSEGSSLMTAIDRYCEISATRDMVVHNTRKATRDYLEKVKPPYRRAKSGELLTVDEPCLETCVAIIKKLYQQLEDAMVNTYGEDDAILNALQDLGLAIPHDPQHGTLPDSPPYKP
jgi:hypothetical protein